MYRLPPLSFVNKVLIIILAAAFILQNIFHIQSYLVLNSSIFSGSIYRIFSYPLVGGGIFEVVFNCLLFWMIGSDLEYLWGRRKYIILLLVGVIGAALTYVALSAFFPFIGPLYGPSGLINLLMVCFAVLYPEAVFSFMFLIPIKAKYFAMLIIGIELYLGFFSPSGISIFAHLGGVAAGYYYIFQLPRIKKRRSKNRLYLIKGLKNGEENRNNDGDFPPKYWH
jgi:membrane associated rhomboid family serine protease